MNEAKIKQYLLRDAKAAGIYARRMEHQYLVGFPDMILKHPAREWVFVEVKWLLMETSTDTYPNRMTAPQKRTLQSMLDVNGKAFLLSVTKRRRQYILRFTQDFHDEVLSKEDAITFEKNYGEKWPVSDFLLAIG
jgi:hypothetical protein